MSEIVDDQEGRTYVRGRTLGKSKTNLTPNSCKTCVVSCEDQWTTAQMDAVVCMSDGNQLLTSALRRAKRTAGNYAALYLSDQGTSQEGRFYWPGLAAFAAKQVVDGIEYADQHLDGWLGQVRTMAAVSFYYLLKGNLWVFLEVTPWMTFYRQHGKELFNHCVDRRDVATYDPAIRPTVERLPWAKGKNAALEQSLRDRIRVQVLDRSEGRVTPFRLDDDAGALAEIDNCRATAPLKKGFAKLQASEASLPGSDERAELAYRGAVEFLKHEQTLHLQKMVYDHRYFRAAMDNNDLGRAVDDWLWDVTGARAPELVFHSEPSIGSQSQRRELAAHDLTERDVTVTMERADGKLYNVEDRMRYVDRILRQYHWLMRWKAGYMLNQLRRIEAWKDA